MISLLTFSTLYWTLFVAMLLAVVGAAIPGLPGISVIVIAIFLWGAATGFGTVMPSLITAVVVLFLSIGVDLLAGYWGAKQAGASKWGQIGAVVGLFVGLFGLLPFLLLGGPVFGGIAGALLGAFVGEYLHQRNSTLAIKAALGILIGTLVGNLIQGLLALMTVIVFFVTTR
jgi:uncharacterized protein